ncbi:ABC transporter permease [Rhizobium leguminosarum]|uniref:ABC transporter permease n=1 Tax=Rhizobium leguminosarum TaxID=384 RepID=UPI001C90358A|nr:ABC transporter permease [Rhizobium leguminosarum]MBY2921250.1 ABC transporter permease [Rhizobium leguminosarum]
MEPTNEHVVKIHPRKGVASVNFAELFEYRYLLYLFIWRDVKTRYKQSYIGIVWILLQPLATMVIYSVFFGYLARFPSEGVPYPVYILAGITCWQFFSRSLISVSTSLADQQALLSKIYFPRLLAPIAALLSSLSDLAVLFMMLLCVMVIFGVPPSFNMIIAFGYLIMLGLLALAIGLILTGLDALIRDVRHGLALVTQLWYFASPIIYPIELVPEKFKVYYLLNPTTPLVQGFRWALLGGNVAAPPAWAVANSACVIIILMLIGTMLFQRLERTIVDHI